AERVARTRRRRRPRLAGLIPAGVRRREKTLRNRGAASIHRRIVRHSVLRVTAASTTDGGETIDAAVTAAAARPRGPSTGWAWLAGGDAFVLRTVPSEASFLNGLGMWVAGMAVVSGFGMTVAASQWWSTSITSVLWVLPLWAVLYCLIERLVLKSFGTS